MQQERMQALKAGFKWIHRQHLKGYVWHVLIILLSLLEGPMYTSN